MTHLKREKKFPVLLDDVLTGPPHRNQHFCLKRHYSLGANRLKMGSSVEGNNSPPFLFNEKNKRSRVVKEKQVERLALTSDFIRRRMIERIAKKDTINVSVLKIMDQIPRHLFVDPAFAAKAYEEIALPIGESQTISRPMVVASMLSHLIGQRSLPLGRLLEIGTGCGYQAALLSLLATDVYSVERIKSLHERAKCNLRLLSRPRPNIRLVHGDGSLGLSSASPFDGIIVSAAGLNVSPSLMKQVSIGGRIIAPVGDDVQRLLLMERVDVARWRKVFLDAVNFVPLKSGVC